MPRELRNGLQGLPTCPICQTKHKCMKGNAGVWCRKVHSAIERQWNTGVVFFHADNPSEPFTLTDIQPATTRTVAKLADKAVLNSVYTAVLDLLTLSDDHRKDNERRGLEPVALGYRTLDQDGRRRVEKTIAAKTGLSVEQLLTVPGFGTNKNGKLYLKGYPGLLVPCRDCEGNIIALRVRTYDPPNNGKDIPRWSYLSNADNGVRVVPAVHWSTSAKTIIETNKAVVLTEGERKAEVFAAAAASRNEPVAVLSIPGVDSWQAAGLIDQLKATGSPKVVVAYDADHQANKDVAAALVRLVIALRTAGLAVDVATWSPDLGKGVDDLILAGHSFEPPDTQFLTGDNLTGYLEGLCDRHLIDRGQVGLFRQGFDQPPAEPAVPAANDDDEAVSKTKEMEPFPLHILPPALAEFAQTIGDDVGVDPVAVALPGLTCLAGLIGNRRKYQVDTNYVARSCLWSAVAIESGSRKTAGLNAAKQPFEVIDQVLFDAYEAEMQSWEAEVAAWEKAKDGPKPKKPDLTTLIIDDHTVETIAKRLADNPRGLLLVVAELDELFLMFERYGSDSNENKYLKLYDGESIKVDRMKHEGQIRVKNGLVSITSTVQPRTLAKLITTDRMESGLSYRFIFANPPRRRHHIRHKTPEELHRVEAATTAYKALVEAIHLLPPLPDVIKPDHAAFAAYREHGNHMEDRIHNADQSERGRLSKTNGLRDRFALIAAVCRSAFEPQTDPFVRRQDVEAGIEFANWVDGESRRVAGVMVEAKTRNEDDDIVRLMMSKPNQVVTARELMQIDRKRFPKAEVALEALEALRMQGRVERFTDNNTGGRPVVRYRPKPNTP